jgi:hypothetical protein
MASDMDAVVALQAGLHARFAALCPSVFPKQFHHFRDARRLAATEAGVAAADEVLKREVRLCVCNGLARQAFPDVAVPLPKNMNMPAEE